MFSNTYKLEYIKFAHVLLFSITNLFNDTRCLQNARIYTMTLIREKIAVSNSLFIYIHTGAHAFTHTHTHICLYYFTKYGSIGLNEIFSLAPARVPAFRVCVSYAFILSNRRSFFSEFSISFQRAFSLVK